jgi:hypothetical protein
MGMVNHSLLSNSLEHPLLLTNSYGIPSAFVELVWYNLIWYNFRWIGMVHHLLCPICKVYLPLLLTEYGIQFTLVKLACDNIYFCRIGMVYLPLLSNWCGIPSAFVELVWYNFRWIGMVHHLLCRIGMVYFLLTGYGITFTFVELVWYNFRFCWMRIVWLPLLFNWYGMLSAFVEWVCHTLCFFFQTGNT